MSPNVSPTPAMTQIAQAANHAGLTHSLLLWGDGDLFATAMYAAAAYQCTAQSGRPCGVCASCKKVFQNMHPDVITVEDSAHKQIAVDVMRAMRADVFIRPNEGKRKVYLFPDAALLTEQDQNVLLKLVEEGPSYAAFLFCAQNPAVMLQTMRSRCVQVAVSGTAQPTIDPLAQEGAALIAQALLRRRGAVVALCAKLEKKKYTRPTLEALFVQLRELCAQALLSQCAGQATQDSLVQTLCQQLSKAQLMGIIDVLQRYYEDCALNIGVGHTLGALAIELEERK